MVVVLRKGIEMTQRMRVQLFLVLVLLGVVVGIIATPATQVAVAAPPCSYCDYQWDGCLEGTLFASCNGDSACCWSHVANCYAWCWE